MSQLDTYPLALMPGLQLGLGLLLVISQAVMTGPADGGLQDPRELDRSQLAVQGVGSQLGELQLGASQ